MAVNIVPHLLAFISKNRVSGAAERHLHQVRQKTVQLHAGMRWPGQTAAPKDSDSHVEVASIFLRGKIRRRLGSSKERMQCLIDPACFGDTRKIFRPRVVVPLLQLLQGNLIRCIAINLVGAQKNENCLGQMLSCRFEEIHRPNCIHLEVEQWNLSRLIVRRLRRAVNDQIEALRSKEFFNARPVADIQRRMCESLGHTL